MEAGGTLPHFMFTLFFQTNYPTTIRNEVNHYSISSDAMVLKYKPTFPRGTKQDICVMTLNCKVRVVQYTVQRKNEHASIIASPGVVMQTVREQKRHAQVIGMLWKDKAITYLSVEFSTQAHSKHTQSHRKGR